MSEYMYNVSANPHVRDKATTHSIMLEVIICLLPATIFGIEKYLGSGLIKGIGPKYAKEIVQQFGKDTLEIIEENPDALIEVPGIGQHRVKRMAAGTG